MADALLLIATAYRTVYGVAGLAVSIVGAVVTWNKGPAFGPKWYPLTLIATALPCARAGGGLRELQCGARRQPRMR